MLFHPPSPSYIIVASSKAIWRTKSHKIVREKTIEAEAHWRAILWKSSSMPSWQPNKDAAAAWLIGLSGRCCDAPSMMRTVERWLMISRLYFYFARRSCTNEALEMLTTVATGKCDTFRRDSSMRERGRDANVKNAAPCRDKIERPPKWAWWRQMGNRRDSVGGEP